MAIVTSDMRNYLQSVFPNIFSQYTSSDASDETDKYNCIAWAYGTDKKRLWPNLYSYEWPTGIPNTEDLASFEALFASIGYSECDNGDLEKGFEKVAIYLDYNGVPSHAARQLYNGYWTSKLGPWIDIEHTIEGMSNGYYGNVAMFMKRPY